ncbi:hypothetical protein MNV49_004261 [Pseudohyphozyma bogoriensis]|nr:hypothetical protein MNV49_004261 [Pseudohyphozyma bogoriensis]
MSYGAARPASSRQAATEVYEADDDAYVYDQFGEVIGVYGADDDDYGEGDEEWYEDGVVQEEVWEEEEEVPPSPPKVTKVSDVPPEAYHDDFALVSCWEAALLDFKYHHPSKFAPLREAPRKAEQKHQAAPLWYGPAPKLPSPTKPTKPKKKPNKRKAKSTSAEPSADASFQPSTKRKRSKLVQYDDGPTWSPRSPEFQRAPSPSPKLPTIALPPPRKTFAGPQLPSPSSFVPPTLPPSASSHSIPSASASATSSTPILTSSKLVARAYPSPPPIPEGDVDLDMRNVNGRGGAGGSEDSPEELLQAALWSWYNAGYQTALYHAALGAVGSADTSERDEKED